MNKKLKAALIVVAVALAIIIPVAVASYLMASNTVDIDVTAQESLTLSTSATSITLGDSVTLTATCSDTAFTGTVAFTANGVSIGSSSATAGVATLLWTPNAINTYTVQASATHP